MWGTLVKITNYETKKGKKEVDTSTGKTAYIDPDDIQYMIQMDDGFYRVATQYKISYWHESPKGLKQNIDAQVLFYIDEKDVEKLVEVRNGQEKERSGALNV